MNTESARRVALCQPLPSLGFADAGRSYSEFPSLGLATLCRALEDAGTDAPVYHPSCLSEVLAAAKDADAVVLGDFRYYTYFCNPLPLVAKAVRQLRMAGFDRPILVAGRLAAWMDVTSFPGLRVDVCPTAGALALALGRPELVERLGAGPLPSPGIASVAVLLADGLLGSVSRPVAGRSAQVTFRTGCRRACSFCEKPSLPRVGFAGTDARRQLRSLREAGATYLVVWDEDFGDPGEDYSGYLRAIRDEGLPFGCNARLATLSDDFVRELAGSGCRSVLVGLEVAPGEDDARRRLRIDRGKALGESGVRLVIERLAACGIEAVGSVLVGLPDDSPARVQERLAACGTLGLGHLYVRPLVPFPGSALFRKAVAMRALAPYPVWPAATWDRFPHGYPVMSDLRHPAEALI